MIEGDDGDCRPALAETVVATATTENVLRGEIRKLDEDQRLVFGWAYVALEKSGDQVVDHSGDFVVDFEKDYEPAAYDYVLHSREGDAMHTEPVTARLVESFVITPTKLEKMGVASDALPCGHWVGFKIEDDEVWKRVKSGELAMFSIAGKGTREAVDA